MEVTKETILSGGALVVVSILFIVYYIAYVIGCWKAFTKAGIAGWKSLIPIYNLYLGYKLYWNTKVFWIFMALTVASSILQSVEQTTLINILLIIVGIGELVLMVKYSIFTAKSYGHGAGFGWGIFLFPVLFMIMLGWDSHPYAGNASLQAKA